MLTLFLVSTTELYQLLKIPTLIEHYWEHKNLNPEMPLIAFLKTHYDHPAKDGDFGKDQKLPFVIHAQPLVLVFMVSPNLNIVINKDLQKTITLQKIPSFDEHVFCKGFRNLVWEPPKYIS